MVGCSLFVHEQHYSCIILFAVLTVKSDSTSDSDSDSTVPVTLTGSTNGCNRDSDSEE
jgi:hypothetical protein